MLMDKLKDGKAYDIEWRDGMITTRCVFVTQHRGFFIFLDENQMKVICRPESIKSVVECEE